MAGTPIIVVAERRWSFVGIQEDALGSTDSIVITNASVLHRWGTSAGIGQLRNGPTNLTKLNPMGTVRLPKSSCLFTVGVDPKVWAKTLDLGDVPSIDPVASSADPIRILMIPERWTMIGHHRSVPNPNSPGETNFLERGFVIRWWGTTRGVGELAGGPTSSTVLDPITSVAIPEGSLGFAIDVDAAKWTDKIASAWGKRR